MDTGAADEDTEEEDEEDGGRWNVENIWAKR